MGASAIAARIRASAAATTASPAAARCAAGSISASERTSPGRIAAASIATTPPYECPTRCAPPASNPATSVASSS
ncbi:MAG TPA: hypothetical protein VGJ11_06295 [Gaiellales bacterium]